MGAVGHWERCFIGCDDPVSVSMAVRGNPRPRDAARPLEIWCIAMRWTDQGTELTKWLADDIQDAEGDFRSIPCPILFSGADKTGSAPCAGNRLVS
jgi:hypothetical protein